MGNGTGAGKEGRIPFCPLWPSTTARSLLACLPSQGEELDTWWMFPCWSIQACINGNVQFLAILNFQPADKKGFPLALLYELLKPHLVVKADQPNVQEWRRCALRGGWKQFTGCLSRSQLQQVRSEWGQSPKEGEKFPEQSALSLVTLSGSVERGVCTCVCFGFCGDKFSPWKRNCLEIQKAELTDFKGSWVSNLLTWLSPWSHFSSLWEDQQVLMCCNFCMLKLHLWWICLSLPNESPLHTSP